MRKIFSLLLLSLVGFGSVTPALAGGPEACPGVVGFLAFDFEPIPLFRAGEAEPFDYIISTPENFENGVFYTMSRQSGRALIPDYMRHGAQSADMARFYAELPEKNSWTRTHFKPGLPYALSFRIIGEPADGRVKIVVDQEVWEICETPFNSEFMEYRPWEAFLQNADEVSFTSLPVYDKPGGAEIKLNASDKHGRPGKIDGSWLEVYCWDGVKEHVYWVPWKNERGLQLDKITVFVR